MSSDLTANVGAHPSGPDPRADHSPTARSWTLAPAPADSVGGRAASCLRGGDREVEHVGAVNGVRDGTEAA